MHKIQIDNFIFHVNVTEYSPEIPGSFNKNAASDADYFGYPEEIDWECDKVCVQAYDGINYFTLEDTDEALEIVDAYAEQITEQLLDKLKFEQECAEEYYV